MLGTSHPTVAWMAWLAVLSGCVAPSTEEVARSEEPTAPAPQQLLWEAKDFTGSVAFQAEFTKLGPHRCRLGIQRVFTAAPPVGPLIFAIVERDGRLEADMGQSYVHMARVHAGETSTDPAEKEVYDAFYRQFGTPGGTNEVGLALAGRGTVRATIAAQAVGPAASLALNLTCDAPLGRLGFALWGSDDVAAFQHDSFEEGTGASVASTAAAGEVRLSGRFKGEWVELVTTQLQAAGSIALSAGEPCDLLSNHVCRRRGEPGSHTVEATFAATDGYLSGIVGGFRAMERFEDVARSGEGEKKGA